MDHEIIREYGSASIHLRPSVEGGGFFRGFGPDELIGRLAILNGLPATAIDMIERGDLDLFKHFVRENEQRPGTYHLYNGAKLTIVDEVETGDKSTTTISGFTEFSPYSPAKPQ